MFNSCGRRNAAFPMKHLFREALQRRGTHQGHGEMLGERPRITVPTEDCPSFRKCFSFFLNKHPMNCNSCRANICFVFFCVAVFFLLRFTARGTLSYTGTNGGAMRRALEVAVLTSSLALRRSLVRVLVQLIQRTRNNRRL